MSDTVSRPPPTPTAFVKAVGCFALIGGAASFLGWAADVPRLTDWFALGISIQPNAAVAVIAAGAALALLSWGDRRPVLVLGMVVGLLGITALLQYIAGIEVETVNRAFMFGRTWGREGVTAAGRMGPPAAFCWTLIGTGLMLLSIGTSKARRAVPPLALLTLGLSMLAITGYLYRASTFYSRPYLTMIAFQTAILVFAISTALIACVDEHGPMHLLRDQGAAGAIARRATPAVVLVAFTLGLVRLAGERAGWFDLATGTAARTIVEIVLLLGVLWWSLTTIRRHEAILRESQRRIADDLTATARLQALSTQLVHPGDLNILLQEILAAAAELTGTDKGNIQMYDPATARLRIIVHQGHGQPFVDYFTGHGWGPTCDAAAAAKSRVIVEDVELEPGLNGLEGFAIVQGDDIRAIQSTPLVSRDGRLLGMLNNHYRTAGRPPERVLRYVDVLARMAADLIERCQTEDAQREADRRKDEFLATLAHELRGPLAPLRNTLEIMKRTGGSPVERQARETMQRQLGQLTRLVEDLIDVSRITHNKIELRMEPVELAPVIHQALESCQHLAAKADLRVRVHAPPEPIYLHADPVRLAQVFGNMLNNACKYTEAGGQIWVDVAREGSDAVVRIKDTGVGIPPDQLDRVFELFTQIDVPFERTHGGLGIGLTLVRRLVEMHGGRVTVQSDGVNRGAEFVVRLPTVEERRLDDRTKLTSAPPASAHRILVVDDNPDAADSLAKLLTLSGNETRTAHDGVEAMEAAERYRPDVVLLDIGLPGLNGLDVCRRIREQPWGREVMVVAVTGLGQEEDRRRSKEAGFDRHLVKPVDYPALLSILAE